MLCGCGGRVRFCFIASYLADMSGRRLRTSVFFAFLAVIGVLSLADRAPNAVKAGLGVGQRAGSVAERTIGFDLLDRGDIPLAFDTAGHLVLWAVAGALASVTFGRRTSRSFIIVALITLSASVELGQGLLSATRHPEVTDLVANGIGIGIGVGAVSAAWIVTSLFGKLSRNLSG